MSEGTTQEKSPQASDAGTQQPQNWRENLIGLIKEGPITFTIIAICTVLFVITAIYDRAIISFNIETLIKLGANFNILIYEGEYWRLFTAVFLHGGILHYAGNMFVLFFIGFVMEDLIGKPKYLLSVFITAIATSVSCFFFNSHRYVVADGISGVTLGLFGALFIYMVLSGDSEKRKAVLNFWFLIFIVAAILGGRSKNADIIGHFYGFLAGVLLLAPYSYFKNIRQTPKIANYILYATALIIALLSLLAILNAPKDVYRFDKWMHEIDYRETQIVDSWEEYDHMETVEQQQRASEQINELNELLEDIAKVKQLQVEDALKEHVAVCEQIIKNDRDFLQKFFFPKEGDEPITQEQVDAFYHIRDSLQSVYQN